MAFTSQPSTSSSQHMRINQTQNNSSQSANNVKYNYIQLLEDANCIGEIDIVNESLAQLENILERGDNLVAQVKGTGELLLDAKVIDSTTTTMENITTNVDVGEGQFRLMPFAEKIKMKAMNRRGQSNWISLADFAPPLVNATVPSWAPLLGSFDFFVEHAEKQEKKKRVFRSRDEKTVTKEPEKLSQIEKKQEGVEEIVQRIFNILKKSCRANQHKPINYFKFVINPDSFPETVENIFHVSFLINDGHAKIEIVDGEPLISTVSKGKENSNPQTQQSRDKKQNIFSIDMQSWQDLVAALQITETMIKVQVQK